MKFDVGITKFDLIVWYLEKELPIKRPNNDNHVPNEPKLIENP